MSRLHAAVSSKQEAVSSKTKARLFLEIALCRSVVLRASVVKLFSERLPQRHRGSLRSHGEEPLKANGRQLLTAFCSLLTDSQFHITNIHRLKSLQELHRFVMFKFRILRFNHQKETVTRRQRKVWGVEDRMIRLRQLIQRQHPEYRGKRRHQHRAFKRNRNERRPTIKWFAADIDGRVEPNHFPFAIALNCDAFIKSSSVSPGK